MEAHLRSTLDAMLAHIVPAPLVRMFARPYLAGDDMTAAVDTAAELHGTRRLVSTLDLLGEDVKDPGQIARNEAMYVKLIEEVHADGRFADRSSRPTVSVKPSAFTLNDMAASFVPIRRLAERARRAQVGLTIDMEDHRWTDATLEGTLALFSAGFDVGTVLQTRLERTEEDLGRIPPGMRVRLVIGIYPEPPEIATTDKSVMKDRMLDFAGRLVARGAYVEFATHDEVYIERFLTDVAPEAPDRCELQMLLGVPRRKLQDDVVSGALGLKIPVRIYVPFAVGWKDATAYLRRRISESPSMVFAVLRNLVSADR